MIPLAVARAFALTSMIAASTAVVPKGADAPPGRGFPAGANLSDPSLPFYIDLGGLDWRTTPPTRDPKHPSYPAARELADTELPPKNGLGNYILGPTHAPAPETTPQQDGPKGRVVEFTMTSADSVVFRPGRVRVETLPHGGLRSATTAPGDPSNLIITTSRSGAWTREVSVYVPAAAAPGKDLAFIVAGDGEVAFRHTLIPILDNLIAANRIPPVVAVLIGSGGQDAQGSERGREYDSVSAAYVDWVEQEVLPRAAREAGVTLTSDPDGRATMGVSSSGAAAFTMAWFRPDLYRRVLAYSPTFVNQQWPHDPALPGGAWEFHSPFSGPKTDGVTARGFEGLVPAEQPPGAPLVRSNARKPIRFWFSVGDRDLFYPLRVMADGMHDWVLASERMAQALAAQRYAYQFVFFRNAGHVDPAAMAQTLPAALEWLWAGYPGAPDRGSASPAPHP